MFLNIYESRSYHCFSEIGVTVEESTWLPEFFALNAEVEEIETYDSSCNICDTNGRWTCQNIYCDNKILVNNTTIVEWMFNKKSSLVEYQYFQCVVAE